DVDDAARQTTLHPRCGTSFLLLVVGVSIAIFSSFFPLLPRAIENDFLNNLAMLGVKLPLMFPIAGVSYELQRLAARRPDDRILRALIAPGLWLQRITTKEPTRDQLEIACCAMKRCIAWEEGRLQERGVTLYRDYEGAIAVP